MRVFALTWLREPYDEIGGIDSIYSTYEAAYRYLQSICVDGKEITTAISGFDGSEMINCPTKDYPHGFYWQVLAFEVKD